MIYMFKRNDLNLLALPAITNDGAGVSLLVADTMRRTELDHEESTDGPVTLVRHTAPCVGVVEGVSSTVVGLEGFERVGRPQSDGGDGDVIRPEFYPYGWRRGEEAG